MSAASDDFEFTPIIIILGIVGAIGTLYAGWKLFIDGYYSHEFLPTMIVGAVGLGALWLAFRQVEKQHRERLAERDREHGIH